MRIHACDAEQQESVACEKRADHHGNQQALPPSRRRAFYIRLDGSICTFAIGSHLTVDIVHPHFEKAFPHIRASCRFLRPGVRRRRSGAFRSINKESD